MIQRSCDKDKRLQPDLPQAAVLSHCQDQCCSSILFCMNGLLTQYESIFSTKWEAGMSHWSSVREKHPRPYCTNMAGAQSAAGSSVLASCWESWTGYETSQKIRIGNRTFHALQLVSWSVWIGLYNYRACCIVPNGTIYHQIILQNYQFEALFPCRSLLEALEWISKGCKDLRTIESI